VGNVVPLHAELTAVLSSQPWPYELIFVDDGSTDGTTARLAEIQDADPEHVVVALLRRNCGQTAALSAALDLARGEILVPIDGDRQNDPADIPRLLERLDFGFDVVSGWRRDRKDALLTRKLPSWIANRLVARLSGVPLHDFGCTLKAYRRGVIEGVRLYGEMHRFIPIFAAWQGARVSELIVNHRPRVAGRTKFILFFMAGVFSILQGLLAEIQMRTYYESQAKKTYLLGEIRRAVPTRPAASEDGAGQTGPKEHTAPSKRFPEK
jgi:glycosyltransferase involved in cell wall biosynthesis